MGETPRTVIEHIKAITTPHPPPSEDPHLQLVTRHAPFALKLL